MVDSEPGQRRLLALAAGLQRELRKLALVVREVTDANTLLSQRPPTLLELRGAADLAHDWYTGLEKCLEQIALQVDGGLPAGPRWHRALLEQVAGDIPGLRPAVLGGATMAELDEYLRFRHLFRSLYGFELRWERVQPLLVRLPQLHAAVASELEAFMAFLSSEATSHD